MSKIKKLLERLEKETKGEKVAILDYHKDIEWLLIILKRMIGNISKYRNLFNKKDITETFKSGRKYNYYKLEINWKETK